MQVLQTPFDTKTQVLQAPHDSAGPPITPQPSNAPVEATGLFARVWYLYFDAVTSAIAAMVSTVADLQSSVTNNQKGAARDTPRQKTQSQLAALAATLTFDDNGLLVEVTDYGHILRWTSPAWGWGPGEAGSGMLVPFAVPPTGVGWHLCDGSLAVPYLKADGTTNTVPLPDTISTATYVKNAPAYNATITAAVIPTVTAPLISTPAITINNFTQSTNNFVAGTVPAVTQTTHAHGASSSTPTASVPLATLLGDPIPNFPAVLYFRQ